MARVITSVNNPDYKALRRICDNRGTHNGAYYYSLEIEKNIAPLIETNRPIDTLSMRGVGSANHAIVFLHHNINHDRTYKWLKKYDDLVLVASSWATYEWAQQAGYKVIYLPLSIDVSYVEKFSTAKTKKACYAGNKWDFKLKDIHELVPEDVDFPPANLERDELLKFIAPYKKCYAIGRCALEAKVLGCKLGVCDSRYPKTSYWEVIDNKEAAKKLQHELDQLDKK